MQACTDCLWYVLGFDFFEETLPARAADDGALRAKALRAMYAAARSLSEQQAKLVDLNARSGLVLDTSARTPEQCANALLDALRQFKYTEK